MDRRQGVDRLHLYNDRFLDQQVEPIPDIHSDITVGDGHADLTIDAQPGPPQFPGHENLVETILPFRIYDLRQTRDPKRTGDRAIGVDPRAFYVMEFLLLNSLREDDLDDEDDAAATGKIFVGKLTDPDLGEVSISAVALKRDLPGSLKPSSSNNRVFHAVNGQVQFKQIRGYLSQSCGFPALKDQVVIVVDASALNFSAHNEVWKGDREHISNTIDGKRYKDLFTKIIRAPGTIRTSDPQIRRLENISTLSIR